ncbi:hypothetical protein Bca101_091712 [Brassica carinata]
MLLLNQSIGIEMGVAEMHSVEFYFGPDLSSYHLLHACQKAHDGCYNFSFYESEIELTDHLTIKTHAHVKVLYWCFFSSITILFHFLC